MITQILLTIFLLPLSPGPDALALYRKLGDSPVPGLRIQALRSLRGHQGDKVRAALVSFLGDTDAGVVTAARDEIERRPIEDGPALVDAVARLRSESARRAGLRALLRRADDLTPFSLDRSSAIRARVVYARRIDVSARDRLMRDSDAAVRAHAAEWLGDSESAPQLARSSAVAVRIAASRTTTDPAVVARLLRDRSWRVQLAAILAAERLRQRDAVPALIEALAQPPGRVRARCVKSLESLTGASHGDSLKRWRAWWGRAGEKFQVAPLRTPQPTSERTPRARPKRTTATVSFRRLPVVSRRVIFVLDASRSMNQPAPHDAAKSRWDLVVSDLVGVLRRLPRGARFNVVLLRTDVTAWRPRLARATAGNVRRCAEWIAAQSPAGWTNLFDALATAIADDDVETIYLLTDGVPSRGAETRRSAIGREIEFLNRFRMVQVHCVQAGSARGLGKAWTGFLDDLASAHDGLCVRE